MARRTHHTRARHFATGVLGIAVATVVVVLGIRPLIGGDLVGMPYTYLTATFTDVGTLKPRLQVRENSVVTGKVTDVRYADQRAVVTLRLDGHKPVYGNATAIVLDESALAQKFVELDRGTPDAGPLGDRPIEGSHTTNASNLDEIFAIFDPATRAALRGTLLETGGGLAGHGDDLNVAVRSAPDLLNDLGTVSGTLAAPPARLPSLLRSADRLMGHFGGHDRQLSALVRDTDATLRAVTLEGGRPLGDVVRRLPATLRVTREALNALDRPLTDVESGVSALRSGATALGRATADLRGAFRGAVAPLDKVPAVADRAEPALDDLVPVVRDARPLIPRLRHTAGDAEELTGGLSPYAWDIGRFFGQQDLLSGQLSPDQHYFSAQLVFPGLNAGSLPDPLEGNDFYPVPNHAGPTRPEGQHPDGGDR